MREVVAVHTKISEEPGGWAPEHPAVTKDLCIQCLPKVREVVLAAIQSLSKEQSR